MGACIVLTQREPEIPPKSDELLLGYAKAGNAKKVRAFMTKYPVAGLQTKLGVQAFIACCQAPWGEPEVAAVPSKKKSWGSSGFKSPAPYQREECIRVLLAAGVDCNRRDDTGLTMLMYAAKIGDTILVELLLERQAQVEAKSLGGWTAIMHAATYLQADAIKVLCEGKTVISNNTSHTHANTTTESLVGTEMVLTAGAENDVQNKANVNAKTDELWTALTLAVRSTNFDRDIDRTSVATTRSSLDRSSQRSRTQTQVKRKTSSSSFQKARIHCVNVLLQAGADPNIADKSGLTPLMSACRNGDVKLVILLLEHNAELKAVQKDGNSALHFAVMSGKRDVVAALITRHELNFHNAMEAVRREEGDNEEVDAVQSSDNEDEDEQKGEGGGGTKHVDITEKMAENIAAATAAADLLPISAMNDIGYTALHYCAYLGSPSHFDIASLLLEGVPPGRLPIDHNVLTQPKAAAGMASSVLAAKGVSCFELALKNLNLPLIELIPPTRKDQEKINAATVELKAGGVHSIASVDGIRLHNGERVLPKYQFVRNSPSDPNIEADFVLFLRLRQEAKANIEMRKKAMGSHKFRIAGKAGDGIQDAFGSVTGGVFTGLGEVGSGALEGASQILHGNVFGGVKSVGKGIFHGVGSAATGVFAGVESIGDGLLSTTKTLGGGLIDEIGELGSKVGIKTSREKLKESSYAADLPEQARSYSSVWDKNKKGTGHARSTIESEQAWSAAAADLKQWVIMDLGSVMPVVGVVTQGRHDPNSKLEQWVKKYTVETSKDKVAWEDVPIPKALSGDDQEEFPGNYDRDKCIFNYFGCDVIMARYVRIKPVTWSKHISMRCDVLLRAMGMRPDGVKGVSEGSARSYSSVKDFSWCPETNFTKSMLDNPYCWASQDVDPKQWSTIDCGLKTIIKGVVTQGSASHRWWVEQFTVQYSRSDPNNFINVDDGKSFDGNSDQNSKVWTLFAEPISARYIRIKPKGWHKHVAMRWDYLMDATPVPPVLADPKIVAQSILVDTAAAQLREKISVYTVENTHGANAVSNGSPQTPVTKSSAGGANQFVSADVINSRVKAEEEFATSSLFESSSPRIRDDDDDGEESDHVGSSTPTKGSRPTTPVLADIGGDMSTPIIGPPLSTASSALAEKTAAIMVTELAKAEREQNRRMSAIADEAKKASLAKEVSVLGEAASTARLSTTEYALDISPTDAIVLAVEEQKAREQRHAAVVKQLLIAPRVHKGVMFKKGDWFGEMKKRIFVLEDSEMKYYGSAQPEHPFGVDYKGSFHVNESLRVFTKAKPEDGVSLGELDLFRWEKICNGSINMPSDHETVQRRGSVTTSAPRRRSILSLGASKSDALDAESILMVRIDTGDRDILKCSTSVEVQTWVEHIQKHLDWFLATKTHSKNGK